MVNFFGGFFIYVLLSIFIAGGFRGIFSRELYDYTSSKNIFYTPHPIKGGAAKFFGFIRLVVFVLIFLGVYFLATYNYLINRFGTWGWLLILVPVTIGFIYEFWFVRKDYLHQKNKLNKL